MRDRPTVLFVNHTLDRKAGGAEQVLAQLLAGLPAKGLEVRLAAPRSSDVADEISPGVDRYHLSQLPMLPGRSLSNVVRTALYLVRANLSLAALVLRLRPDVIYVNSIFALHFAAVPAAVLRVPFLYHEHNLVSQRAHSIWHRWFSRLVGRAARVVAISDAVATELKGVGVSEDRIAVVHNAIESPDPLEQPPRRAENAPFRVVQVANLHAWKGHHTIIDAVAIAVRDGLDATATFFGREQDAAYARGLRERARTAGVADRIEFRGFVPDAARRLAEFDAAILASDSEPFGLAILEGMRAGVPVIASSAGGALEIVEHDVSGLLFEPGDAPALAACWQRLSADAELRDAIVRGAFATLANRFSPEAQIEGVRDAIERVLA